MSKSARTYPLGGAGKKSTPHKPRNIIQTTNLTWSEQFVFDPETPDDMQADASQWEQWQGRPEFVQDEEAERVAKMIGAHPSQGYNPLREKAELAAWEMANRPDPSYQEAERVDDPHCVLPELHGNPFEKPHAPPPRKGRIVFDDEVAFDVPLSQSHREFLAKRYDTSVEDPDIPSSVRIARHIWVYLPPSYDDAILDPNSTRNYPVLYMLDGQNAFSYLGEDNGGGWGNWGVDEWIERLANPSWSPSESSMHPIHHSFVPGQRQMHAPRIREPIVVAIGCSNNRFLEYRGPSKCYTEAEMAALKAQGVPPSMRRHPGQNAYYESFRTYLCEFLKPKIDQTYRTLKSPESTCILGSSMGGICAFVLAWERPDVFGITIPVSPAFLVESEFFLRECVMRNGVKLPTKGKCGPDTCLVQRTDLGWTPGPEESPKFNQQEYDKLVKDGISGGDVVHGHLDEDVLPFRIYLDTGISDYMGDDDGYFLTRELYNHLIFLGYPPSPSPHLSFYVDTQPASSEEELRGHSPVSKHGNAIGGGYALPEYKWEDARVNQHNEWYWRRRLWRMLEWAFPAERLQVDISGHLKFSNSVSLGTEAWTDVHEEVVDGRVVRTTKTTVTHRDFVDGATRRVCVRRGILNPTTAPEDGSEEDEVVSNMEKIDSRVEEFHKRNNTQRPSSWSKLATLARLETFRMDLPAELDQVEELRAKLAKAQMAVKAKKAASSSLANFVSTLSRHPRDRV
jgi:predicted alpha/beta superfamily hydrolase